MDNLPKNYRDLTQQDWAGMGITMDRLHPSSREGVRVFASCKSCPGKCFTSYDDINSHLGSRFHCPQNDLELD
jgi:hypothetical protein